VGKGGGGGSMTSIDRNGMRIHFPLTPVNKGMKKQLS
jgi:hypothetical protein